MIAAGTSIDLPAWAAILGLITSVAFTVTSAVIYSRQVIIRQTLASVIDANTELRSANADLKGELAAAKLETAKLEGRLDAVTSHLADQIVKAVADAVARSPLTVTTTTGIKGVAS